MNSSRTTLDVDLELSALASQRSSDRWHFSRNVRESTLTPEYRASFTQKADKLLDERLELTK